MTIFKNNIKIEVKQIRKNFFSITRTSKAKQIITIYARRKNVDEKITFLLNNLTTINKALCL